MRRYIASIAEDVKVPAVVFDALAPLIVARADGTSASAVPKPAERRKAERRVRKWVLELLRSSLAIGSVGLGIGVHDIVRDYARSRVQAEEGGLAALQRSVVTALLQALPERVEPSFMSTGGVEQSELSVWVGEQLTHHTREAMAEVTELLSDPWPVVWTCLDEDDDAWCVARPILCGIGGQRLKAGARSAEAAGVWINAAKLWRGAFQASLSEGRTDIDSLNAAIAAISKVSLRAHRARDIVGLRTSRRASELRFAGRAFHSSEPSASCSTGPAPNVHISEPYPQITRRLRQIGE